VRSELLRASRTRHRQTKLVANALAVSTSAFHSPRSRTWIFISESRTNPRSYSCHMPGCGISLNTGLAGRSFSTTHSLSFSFFIFTVSSPRIGAPFTFSARVLEACSSLERVTYVLAPWVIRHACSLVSGQIYCYPSLPFVGTPTIGSHDGSTLRAAAPANRFMQSSPIPTGRGYPCKNAQVCTTKCATWNRADLVPQIPGILPGRDSFGSTAEWPSSLLSFIDCKQHALQSRSIESVVSTPQGVLKLLRRHLFL
jgi:hypothetical protein